MENKESTTVIDFTKDPISDTESLSPTAQVFKQNVDRMTRIFIAKNNDYGDSFSESVKELGPIAGFTPIMHKFNRLKNLIKGNARLVEGETVEDTLLDMANYCIMLKMELERV